MMLIDAYKIRCDRNDYDTYKDYMTAFNAIVNAKPIDAEPIIRCKDCLNTSIGFVDGVPTLIACNIHEHLVEPMDYCSRGERKEE